ncbi:MAG: Gfo/Idh/MocA family oxidoreductase [Saprospiraceae bacterium]|nr:Gfo/Idh/MocA family oxidoreductase [Saprospiraceae bacterium]
MDINRRDFIQQSAVAAGGIMIKPMADAYVKPIAKKRLALVGTGDRGTGFWGKALLENYKDLVEFVGLCDINPGRLEYAKSYIGADCRTYIDFDEMMREKKPDTVIVTTVDATHHEFIVKALQYGADVITEKPMTTDEVKCQQILDAEKKSGKKVTVGFNYRHNPHVTRIKELLTNQRVGKITSVDFHWYLNVYHGADYFRRWHGFIKNGGSLWVHKATHHFDLLNWWLDSDPVEVMAFGKLDHYGKNNAFRGKTCRDCSYTKECKFYTDINKNQKYVNLYVKNEHHDGYFRDSCVFRNEIDIWDKMSAQIIYANGVTVNYSLTTYSPYEGWKLAFNGFNGRIDSWEDIPFQKADVDQANRHSAEMTQNKDEKPESFDEIFVMDNFSRQGETIYIPKYKGGHGGGDRRMHDLIFNNPKNENPYKIMAGTRDGAMSCLIGIAARKSIAMKRSVKISELTDIMPSVNRA